MTNAELVRRFQEEFKNRSNFDVVDELFGDNFVHHLPIPGLPPGRDGMKAVGHVVTGAVGDIVVTVDILLSEGDLVANRNSVRGMRKKDGKALNWIEHEIWRARNGRLVEQWSVADGLDLG